MPANNSPTRCLRLLVALALTALISAACQSVTADQEDDLAAALAPPNAYVLLADYEAPVVTVYDIGGEELRTVQFDADQVLLLRSSAYGPRSVVLLDSDDGSISAVVLDAVTGEINEVTTGSGSLFVDLQPQPGERWHTFFMRTRDETHWATVNLATGSIFRPTDPADRTTARFSADESRLAYVRSDGTAWVVDTDTFDESLIATNSLDTSPQLSPSGRRAFWYDPDDDVAQGSAFVTDLETGEIVELPATNYLQWVDDDVLLSEVGAESATIDARTGKSISNLPFVVSRRSVRNGRALVLDPGDGLVQVADLMTGKVTDHEVPTGLQVDTIFDRNDRFLWGAGGASGSVGTMQGWIYNPVTGGVSTFDNPIADNAIFGLSEAAFNVDMSVAAIEVDGTTYRIGSDGTVTAATGATDFRPGVCPDGDIIAISQDGAASRLLSGDDLDPVATFGPGTQAHCLTETR